MIAAAMIEDSTAVPEWGVYELPHLREWRRYAVVTLRELAQAAGVSYATLRFVEMGRARTRGRKVTRLADALGVPAPVLITYGPQDREAHQWAAPAALHGAAIRAASMSRP